MIRHPATRGACSRRASHVVAALALVAVAAVLAACGGPPASVVTRQHSSRANVAAAAGDPAPGDPAAAVQVNGRLSAPGGPYLVDRFGRVVILHGVNAVEKNPPYELTVTPNRPWTFDAADARRIAALGFDVVRLGVLWQGLEPGPAGVGANDPAVCAPGAPAGGLGFFDARTAAAYLAKVAKVVDLLGRAHVYTLLDMHQDVYSQAFAGEGAPAWAVCTDGQPVVLAAGRWSKNYADTTLHTAMTHFWTNDVVGNLQGQFDRAWGFVAHRFAHNPWVVGYDPFNEPFEPNLSPAQSVQFATQLECFYTGRRHPGALKQGGAPVTCPAGDPAEGVVPTIEAADHQHLVFIEPDIYGIPHGAPAMLGPMPFPRLVFNFHVYCGARSPVTGDPTTLVACVNQELQSMSRLEQERALLSSPEQPGGPPAFMSEFGASQDPALIQQLTSAADQYALGWAYWAWKYYDDPTGSSNEGLVEPSGHLAPTAPVLSATYAQAVAGTPVSVSWTPLSGAYTLVYAPNPAVAAPTVLFVGQASIGRAGYCTTVRGGTVTSKPGARHLLVQNAAGASQVVVTLAPGWCR